ncbi:dTDP-4-dehydrorhamnose 3,5-epimerase [Xanthobacter sp. V4C-4]|uniref:dTDP-4-dehydrorhamnose 3,5-epimerase n=1 Tax=Xanthobacter cornucopiae TaxID=3119924 RepID=UPI003726733E
MKFQPTAVDGAVIIDVSPFEDERGSFARAFCADTFRAEGLMDRFVHANTSWNPKAGTLRGLHLQDPPRAEAKLVRAVRGRVFDVAVDLRPSSPTYLRWAGVELSADRRNAFHVPQGCAHGFLTLEDACEVFYLVSDIYAADLARTYRWNDPAFGVDWPAVPQIISTRDATAEDYTP